LFAVRPDEFHELRHEIERLPVAESLRMGVQKAGLLGQGNNQPHRRPHLLLRHGRNLPWRAADSRAPADRRKPPPAHPTEARSPPPTQHIGSRPNPRRTDLQPSHHAAPASRAETPLPTPRAFL
jgi:hypothetical protein